MPDHNAYVTDKIFEGRSSLGLTQQDVADRSGVSVRTIRRLEAGDVDSVSFGSVVAVLGACGYSVQTTRGVPARGIPDQAAGTNISFKTHRRPDDIPRPPR